MEKSLKVSRCKLLGSAQVVVGIRKCVSLRRLASVSLMGQLPKACSCDQEMRLACAVCCLGFFLFELVRGLRVFFALQTSC